MNKTAIKNFAIWARNKLIADISYRAGLMGITADGIRAALPQSTGQTEFYDIGTAEPYAITGEAIRQRRHLVELIQRKEKDTDYKTAYKYIIEEVAYTWFNRLIAVRFMEVNDYLPSHIRVLSSDTGKLEPDLVTTPFDAELEFTNAEQQTIIDLKNANKLDEVFRVLFIKQCNALNEILPALFEKTNDYTELLLNLSVIDQDGVVYHLVHDVPEEDFDVERGGQVEIIGWLYQYYISEKHDEVVDPLHGKVVEKEEVPAATQLFTTDWVVRYLIDNSVGRYWIERNPNSILMDNLTYLAKSHDGIINKVNEKITPQDVTVLDPCVGSGHFLIYAFDVLISIYQEYGYSERDAADEIVKNNLYGLDIDGRATQLAYFSVMMKARQYDKRFFSRGIQPHVCEIKESNSVDSFSVEYFVDDDSELKRDIEALLCALRDAKEYGSTLHMPTVDFRRINDRFLKLGDDISIYNAYLLGEFQDLIRSAEIMCGKYSVVITNPPYLNKYDAKLKKYIFENYSDYKGDLFSVFMYKNFDYCKEGGYSGFMTPMVWMFIQTYEKLRDYIIREKRIITLIQMEYSAYEEATVPICTFVLGNFHNGEKGYYFDLSNFSGGMEIQRKKVIEAINNSRCGFFYESLQDGYALIPGSPIAYGVKPQWFNAFQNNPIMRDVCVLKKGTSTGDNKRFIRLWQEIDITKACFTARNPDEAMASRKKWFPINGGGERRKWYGNRFDVVNWEKDGQEMKEFATKLNHGGHWSRYIINPDRFFTEAIGWSAISSSKISVRYVGYGFAFSSAAMEAFEADLKYILALINSVVAEDILKLLAPTINFGVEQIGKIPYIRDKVSEVESITNQCIDISKEDWDSFEISWDFKTHPFISYVQRSSVNNEAISVREAFADWQMVTDNRCKKLKENEEELNRLFISIYGLQNELSPDVTIKDITVRCADLKRDVRSFLSYAVGCMFGRYATNYEGIAYAGGIWDASRYTDFLPDKDNVIPITDEEYLEDDIVSRFCAWLKDVFGEASLEDNLDFIAVALGNKGNSSRGIIRNYFLNEFFKDHEKIYQKRPIYWLFDSGKQNGFKALIYLHRYNADTIGNLRIDYLHRMQRVYESEISRMQDMIDHSTNAREVGQATKRRDKLTKQLKECREYDEKLAHLALSRIELDLDDGVKVNYRKLQTANDGKFYEVLADSKNIMAKK